MPALLPMISSDLQLADSQGAALTVGYTVRWVPSRGMQIPCYQLSYFNAESKEVFVAYPDVIFWCMSLFAENCMQ